MARLFDDASSESLDGSASPVTAWPCTLACWFNSDSQTVNQWIMWLGTGANATNGIRLAIEGAAAGDKVNAGCKSGSTTYADAVTSTGYTAGTWHHACGVFTNNTSRDAYIDGGSSGNNATSRTFPTVGVVSIGREGDSTPTGHFSGMIAEAAIWDAALTAAEITALARACTPLEVRPSALVAYWPLIGKLTAETDRMATIPLTASGTVAAAHPRMTYRRRGRAWHVPAAAPPATGGSSTFALLGVGM